MKNKIIVILSGVIITFGLIIYLLFSKMIDHKQDAIRWKSNYNETKKEISKVELTLKEFKEQSSEREDSLLNLLNIKPKQVERIIYVENKIEVKDTVKIEVESNKQNTSPLLGIYPFKKQVSCISLEGYAISANKPEIYLTYIKSNSKISYVAYKQRKKRKILFFNTRFLGKKETKLEVKNSCGKIEVLEIDIIKKK